MNQSSLFEGRLIYLDAPDPDHDTATEVTWSEDPSYLTLVQKEPARPLTLAQARKKYRQNENSDDSFLFAIRLKEIDRLLGFVEIKSIQWSHRIAWIEIRIGRAEDRKRGYGSEALSLVLRYAFNEINLDHLICHVYEYNFPARQFFEKAGFKVEVRQREALLRFGRRWDLLVYGLLKSEWGQLSEGESENGR